MQLELITTWLVVQFVGLLIPGPDFFMVTSLSFRERAVGIAAGAGITCALMFWVAGSIFGATALIVLWPTAFLVLRALGLVFILYMSANIIIGALKTLQQLKASDDVPEMAKFSKFQSRQWTIGSAFTAGFVNGILNPKTLIYFSTTISQFVRLSGADNLHSQFIWLATSYFVLSLAYWSALAVLVNVLAKKFATRSFRTKIELVSGCILGCIALLLAYDLVTSFQL